MTSTPDPLPEYLLLDGGLGTELIEKCGNRREIYLDPVWTMSLSLSDTDSHFVTEAQRTFLEAGADLIMTNTFRAFPLRLMKKHFTKEQAANEALRNEARKTCALRDEFWNNLTDKRSRRRPLVAAAMGPFGCAQDTGCDYAGKYVDTTAFTDMVEVNRSKVRAMLDGGVDFLGFEAIPAAKEAEAICYLMKDFPEAKAWIAYCCEDGEHVGHGEKLRDAVALTLSCDAIVAVGINCTCPKFVTSLLQQIPAEVKQKKKIVVYPNNSFFWDKIKKEWVNEPDSRPIQEYVPEWLENGANWIGGCCHVTSEHLAQMKTKMDQYLGQ